MISALIKGNQQQAMDAANARGIPCKFNRETMHETSLLIDDAYALSVAYWFQEDVGNGAPYPIGSCLLYTFK